MPAIKQYVLCLLALTVQGFWSGVCTQKSTTVSLKTKAGKISLNTPGAIQHHCVAMVICGQLGVSTDLSGCSSEHSADSQLQNLILFYLRLAGVFAPCEPGSEEYSEKSRRR